MPGTITFRPIEANLTHNTDLIGKMSPYCAFIVGDSVFKGQICKKGGKHPYWTDAVTVPVGNQSQVVVELMDKDRFSRDDNIGSFLINLRDLQSSGKSSRWYPLTYKNKPAGEILLETVFSDPMMSQGHGYNQNLVQSTPIINEQTHLARETIIEQPVVIEQPVIVEKEIIQQRASHIPERHLFTEQQQIVEPRTFLKEVDVVETRARLENIEVLEPQKVLKEVQYTQAVPVRKTIEVVEPRVVMKEVEVIEPRLVTKTIQVIENVPVKKMVEVIESVPRTQEIETFEPQTFTKQVEVTDYVPVLKQVTVTEPVHMKKAVEFVEPVITTKTITKELVQPIIVDEKITTTVGPASLLRESEIYSAEFKKFGITEESRRLRFRDYERLRREGYNDARLEEYFTTQGWGPVKHYRFYEMSGTPMYSEQDRMTRFGEFNRLRGLGYTDSQLDNHFTTQGWGPINSYRFHEMSGYSPMYSEQDRMTRFGEFNRLRGLGYTDSQLDNHFTTQGWGPINSYRFHELGSKHHGSHFTPSFTEDERLFRYGEWSRLRNQGYNDSQLDNHFATQGWGPINNYQFHTLGNKGLTGANSGLYQANAVPRNF